MPLLEIVRTPQTPPQVVRALSLSGLPQPHSLTTSPWLSANRRRWQVHACIALAAQIKKVPVVVGNCTGFAVNRVFFPYTMAAIMLVDGGMDPYAIDKVNLSPPL
jgi:3-hydroxyacyl-CoA dehydrogenase